MRVKTLWEMMGRGDIRMVLKAFRMMEPMHRMAWLGAATRHGVLKILAATPSSFETLAQTLSPDPSGHAGLRAWLRHGILLKEIRFADGVYSLRGVMARGLAEERNDRFAAYLESLTAIHHAGIHGVLDKLAAGETFGLSEIDAPLIARVSQMTAPVLYEIVDDVVPSGGAVTLLDLGCGAGGTMRRACANNPELTAVGVDFDPDVAAQTRAALAAEGLEARTEVVAADLRTLERPEPFDIVTMFNLIYYMPEAERAAVLAHVAGLVRPGGTLVMTASCAGGTIANNMLDIWFSAMPQCGPLPEPEALVEGLRSAGLTPETPRRAMPGEAYYRFVAHRAST